MATCLSIVKEEVRATIKFSGLEVSTPYVKAFNIEQVRGKPYKTFSATIEIPAGASFIPGSDIEIWAGTKNNQKRRFTGVVRQVTTQPVFDKAGYFSLSLSGTDRLGLLEDKRFSRRLRSDGIGMLVSIEGGPSNRPSRGMSIDKRIRGGKHTFTSNSPRPDGVDHTKLTKMPKRGSNKHGTYGLATGVGAGNEDTGGALTVHDHTSLQKGGPAWGTFATD